MFDKKDGSIVYSLKRSDGTIITDPVQVAQALMEKLKEVQCAPDADPPILPEFPNLPNLTTTQMEEICKCLSHRKATSLDLFSDIIISDKEAFKACCQKLSDLWNCDLNELEKKSNFGLEG